MQHRSFRGTLTSNIKDAVFAVFGSGSLPTINLKSKPEEIVRWKNSSKVKKCRENLHKKTTDGPTFMTLIIKKVWSHEDVKKICRNWVAFAIAVAEILLDSDISEIQVTESMNATAFKKYSKFSKFTKMMLISILIFLFFFLETNIKRKLWFRN